MEKDVDYGGGAPSKARRDPQLVADPSVLTFTQDTYPQESYLGESGYPGAVNTNVAYSGQHSVYIPPTAVLREQYCICAPQTKTERRLLVTVVVLAVTVLLLLATVATIAPMVACGDDCEKNKSSSSGNGILDFLTPSRMLPAVQRL